LHNFYKHGKGQEQQNPETLGGASNAGGHNVNRDQHWITKGSGSSSSSSKKQRWETSTLSEM